jgi:two-component system response regulator NreC
MTTRILIADDHKIIRDGLRSLIEKQEGMEVVAEADDGLAALRLAEKMKPDVVIIDVAMPGMNGIEATRRITSGLCTAKVIALSMHADRRFVLGMFKAGASAYLLKDCAFTDLAQALNAVIGGRTYLSPQLTDAVLKDYLRDVPEASSSARILLSEKEREVLQLVAEGQSTSQIAARLAISAKTVEIHRHHIMKKTGVHNIAELTKYAVREGLTSLDT